MTGSTLTQGQSLFIPVSCFWEWSKGNDTSRWQGRHIYMMLPTGTASTIHPAFH